MKKTLKHIFKIYIIISKKFSYNKKIHFKILQNKLCFINFANLYVITILY